MASDFLRGHSTVPVTKPWPSHAGDSSNSQTLSLQAVSHPRQRLSIFLDQGPRNTLKGKLISDRQALISAAQAEEAEAIRQSQRTLCHGLHALENSRGLCPSPSQPYRL